MSLSTLAEQTQFGDLPWDFVALVFLRLPVDARLRARKVCRGWRALLNEPRFWLALDFLGCCAVVARVRRCMPLFAAGEGGRGHLHTLELTGVWDSWLAAQRLSAEHLTQFVAAHGQSLRSVTAPEGLKFSADEVTRLRRSAPLCTLRCCVECSFAEALPLLRCEASCALLHVVKLVVRGFPNNNEHAVRDFAAALPSLRGKIKGLYVGETLLLQNVAVADALLHGIAEAGVSDVIITECRLPPASLPGLTRLLQAGCLERLCINNSFQALFEEGPNLTAFCHALRGSTLQKLELHLCELWRDPAVADELLAALVGHQTLRVLSLAYNGVDRTDVARRAAGEQLASLIMHTSALEKLDIRWNNLGEAGLAPIFKALARSSTLKELMYSFLFNEIVSLSRVFARYIILPAVRANTSLRTLNFGVSETRETFLSELTKAQAIVAARAHNGVPPPSLLWNLWTKIFPRR